MFVCFSEMEYFSQESYLNNNKQTSSSQRKYYITIQHYDAHEADIQDLSDKRSKLVLIHTKEMKDCMKILKFCRTITS